VAAVNVALMYGLLDTMQVSEPVRRWLTALFAAGTVHWYVAAIGSYWFNAHVVAVLFVILYVRETLGCGRGYLAGFWLVLAGLARPTALFAAPFFVVWEWSRRRDAKLFLRALISFGSVLALGVGVHLVYNVTRFGTPLNFGYAYVQGAENITSAYAHYGGFNLHFVPFNLYVSLLRLPDLLSRFPFLRPSPWGMSMFLTTPAFFYIFATFRRAGGEGILSDCNPLVIASWAGLLGVMIPLWMYHNTGSLQFGYRYSLDAAPFLMLLTAIGMQGQMNWLKRGLIIASILINWAGMAWMFAHFNGFGWVGMWYRLVVR
jgi:hypothetical protein